MSFDNERDEIVEGYTDEELQEWLNAPLGRPKDAELSINALEAMDDRALALAMKTLVEEKDKLEQSLKFVQRQLQNAYNERERRVAKFGLSYDLNRPIK